MHLVMKGIESKKRPESEENSRGGGGCRELVWETTREAEAESKKKNLTNITEDVISWERSSLTDSELVVHLLRNTSQMFLNFDQENRACALFENLTIIGKKFYQRNENKWESKNESPTDNNNDLMFCSSFSRVVRNKWSGPAISFSTSCETWQERGNRRGHNFHLRYVLEASLFSATSSLASVDPKRWIRRSHNNTSVLWQRLLNFFVWSAFF